MFQNVEYINEPRAIAYTFKAKDAMMHAMGH